MNGIFHTTVYWIPKSYLLHTYNSDSIFVDWRCQRKC